MKQILMMSCDAVPDWGGVESFVLNILENCSPKDYVFDWFFPFGVTASAFLEALKSSRVRRIVRGRIGKKYKDILGLTRKVNRLVDFTKYDVVHIQATNILPVYGLVKAVRSHYGGKLIVHAHSANEMMSNDLVHRVVRPILKAYVLKKADVCAAASIEAAKFSFGKNIASSDKFYFFPNTIDSSKYIYSKLLRQKLRAELSIDDDTYLIGSVCRLIGTKNLDFFMECLKTVPAVCNVMYVVVGEGAEREKLENLASTLRQRVLFAGVSNEIQKYLSGMDLFVMPSKHEGFGIAALEAQASGLPCLLSSNIPGIVDVTDRVAFLPPDESAKWTGALIRQYADWKKNGNKEVQRLADNDTVRKSIFSNEHLVETLGKLYG